MQTGTQRSRQQKETWFCNKRRGGWSVNAEYEPKYCLNKISGNFRIQIFFMFHVNLHVQHRNHIFTIMSGISRAMQAHMYSNAIGRHQRITSAGITCVHFRITVRTHMHHNSTPAAHMATLIHASTHSHALWNCNLSSCIVSHINEAATELLKTKLQKSQGNALQNQINKGETARSILALIIVVIDVIVTNMISWF